MAPVLPVHGFYRSKPQDFSALWTTSDQAIKMLFSKALFLGPALYLSACVCYQSTVPSRSLIETRTLEAALVEADLATRGQKLSLRHAFDLHYVEGELRLQPMNVD